MLGVICSRHSIDLHGDDEPAAFSGQFLCPAEEFEVPPVKEVKDTYCQNGFHII